MKEADSKNQLLMYPLSYLKEILKLISLIYLNEKILISTCALFEFSKYYAHFKIEFEQVTC